MTASTAATANAPALHPVPERNTIVKEQIESVSIAIRKEQLFYVGTLVVFLLLGIYSALRGTGGHDHGNFDYGPAATIPVTLVALLIPFGVWRASTRDRRAYDWAMPVAQSSHTIIRMLAGWLWLMLGVAAYLVFLVALEYTMVLIAGGSLTMSVAGWEWLVPFTSATIAYLLISIPIIASEHPWRWIGGIIVGFFATMLILNVVELRDVAHVLEQVVSGFYGLSAAIFGDVASTTHNLHGAPDATRWLRATLLWGVLSIAGAWLAARRHSTS